MKLERGTGLAGSCECIPVPLSSADQRGHEATNGPILLVRANMWSPLAS